MTDLKRYQNSGQDQLTDTLPPPTAKQLGKGQGQKGRPTTQGRRQTHARTDGLHVFYLMEKMIKMRNLKTLMKDEGGHNAAAAAAVPLEATDRRPPGAQKPPIIFILKDVVNVEK